MPQRECSHRVPWGGVFTLSALERVFTLSATERVFTPSTTGRVFTLSGHIVKKDRISMSYP